jgi:tetratricopeptide (TPR) repeat protein
VSLNKELTELAARLKSWLSDTSALDSVVVCEVLALPIPLWRAFFEAYPSLQRATIAEALMRRASVLQRQAPKEAVPVCRLAINFAKSFVGRTTDEKSRGMLLEADAWREYAWALMQIGDFDDAKVAADEASFNYNVLLNDGEAGEFSLPAEVLAHHLKVIARYYRNEVDIDEPVNDTMRLAMENSTRLGVIIGQILHNLGNTDEGLSTIANSCEVLLFLDNRDRYVRARMVYAGLLTEAHRWSEALEVFESTATLAADSDDLEVQAFLVGNIAGCYYYLGDHKKAKECVVTAIQMLEHLDLHLEAIRPRTLLVLLLMDEGKQNRAKYHVAAAELFKVRAVWLEAGMKNEAARVMVRIIRALILGGRAEHINWPEMNHTFGQARLGRAALNALRHLEEIAAQRTLTADDVDAAEELLAHLAPSGEVFEETG